MHLRTGSCQDSPRALRRCSAELLPDAFGFRSPAYGNNVLALCFNSSLFVFDSFYYYF